MVKKAKSKEAAVAARPAAAVPAKVNADVPAHLRGYESKGVGVPSRPEDFLLPMAKVLGHQSPEVIKGPARVADAEAGDILIKNAPIPLIKADTGFLFQPCFRDEADIEWLPRGKGGGGGSGFVARHPPGMIGSKDSEQVANPQDPSKLIWIRRTTKNQLVNTRYVSGFLISKQAPPMPLVLPFASTGHTSAKQWNLLIASQRLGDVVADIWLVYYMIRTRLRTRGDQSWYTMEASNAGDDGGPLWVPTMDDAERGHQLYDSLARGERQYATPERDDEPGDDNQAKPF